MKTLLIAAFVAAVLVIGNGAPAMATAHADGAVGACPDSFKLHPVHEHENHGHKHVGTETDKNDDDFVCVKHVSAGEDIHVHIDNNLPL